jgi:hypothetical protein
LEKLSKEIAEGYLFELEVDKLINETFEEIKKKENLDENVTFHSVQKHKTSFARKIESIERLKQDLIKDAVELDINDTLKDAIGHAIRLKVEIKNYIEFLNQEIEEK